MRGAGSISQRRMLGPCQSSDPDSNACIAVYTIYYSSIGLIGELDDTLHYITNHLGIVTPIDLTIQNVIFN